MKEMQISFLGIRRLYTDFYQDCMFLQNFLWPLSENS
jgi:hypothetical protein